MRLKEHVAVVTGASRGIGRSTALALGREGATVVLAARTDADLKAVALEVEQVGGSADIAVADLTNEADIKRLFDRVRERHKRLDILVNNAGIGRFAPVRQLTLDDLDEMWKLNVRGVFLCTQAALPIMEPQNSGVIVNIASLAGKNAFVNGAGYAATKWALRGFSQCLMLEERQFNIRVITICPGSVETSFSPRTVDPAKKEWIVQP
ncbi:MAG: SDR family oxidoreductase, partial [Bacteroidetes bacterium]|nr:SDR family oxidoreductase [Bacteroidota bacterium]